jgi:hypothetical protein
MEKNEDIAIVATFSGAPHYPAKLIGKTLDLIETGVFVTELDEVDALQKTFKDVPNAIFDAVRWRVRTYQGATVHIENAGQGSIILGGLVAGVAVWVLQQTLGETIKEAWRESSWHEQLKHYLTQQRGTKARKIKDEIIKMRDWDEYRVLREYGCEMEVAVTDYYQIRVNIIQGGRPMPPTRGELLSQLDHHQEG